MVKPRISYLQITARENCPTLGLPNLHLWEPTLQTLAKQTFKEIEFIVIDVFYHERPDYFKDHNYGLRIKHVPASPNPWSELGLCQTCHQFNKGIIHADGELIFTDADSSMVPPDLMANLWKHYKDGYFVSLGFGADLTYAADEEVKDRKLMPDGTYEFSWQGMKFYTNPSVPTDWYGFLGFQGKRVSMDHRYEKLFHDSEKQMNIIHPDWYYGISTVSLEAALKLNGYDLNFDGDSVLNDVDFGHRLQMAGYNNLAMFRDSYIIEAYAKLGWHPKMKPRIEIKCNYALMLYNNVTGRYRVNEPLSQSDVDYIIRNVCGVQCNIKTTCQTYYKHRAPFYDKNVLPYYEHWKKKVMPTYIDFEAERELRIAGEKYQEGTFVNVN